MTKPKRDRFSKEPIYLDPSNSVSGLNMGGLVEWTEWSPGFDVKQHLGAPCPVLQGQQGDPFLYRVSDGTRHGPWCTKAYDAVSVWNSEE